MSTIIFNIVVIMAIMIIGSYIIFLLGCLFFSSKKENVEEKDYSEEIKKLKDCQTILYNRLIELDSKKETVKECVCENCTCEECVCQKQEDVNVEPLIVTETISEEKIEVQDEDPDALFMEEVEKIIDENKNNEKTEEVVEEIKVVANSIAPEIERKKVPSKRRSFTIKISSSTEATKKYFSEITNRLRLFGLTARVGKSKVLFRLNKEIYARIIFKGKRIVLCLPLDPKDEKYNPEIYKQIDYSTKKGFEEVPFGIKITNKKVVELVMGLIDEVIKKFELIENPKFKEVNYVEKFPDIYTEFEKEGYGYLLKTEVLKEDVSKYDDKFADKIILDKKLEETQPKRFVKAEVSIQEFNNRYTDTSIPVDLDRLKGSDLVSKNSNYLIVKASSRIDQAFTVYANEFEPDAVKMICLAGGKAVKISYMEEN